MEKDVMGKDMGLFVPSAIGFGLAVLLSPVLLSIAALIITGAEDPKALVSVGRLLPFPACFAGGAAATLISGRRALLTGLISGLMYSALMLMISLGLGYGIGGVWFIPAVLASFIAGAFIGNIRGGRSNVPAFDSKKYVTKPKG